MKVKHVLNDLGDDVKVQIFDSVGNEKYPVFCYDFKVSTVRCGSHLHLIKTYLNRKVDHTEYISVGTEFFCKIYLTPKTNDNEKATVVCRHSQDILPLNVFLKNLHPDAFAVCKLWYGDPADGAGECIELRMCGADYKPANNIFKEFSAMVQAFKVVKIYVDANKQLRVDCVRKEK